MLPSVPHFVSLFFVGTTLLTLFLLWKAFNKLRFVLIAGACWIVIQGIIALTEFYSITDSMPPRILLLMLPPIATLLLLFLTKRGRKIIDSLPLSSLHLLHVVRIPVEITLYFLFIYGTIPELMTFDGRNFDILIGLTAPFAFFVSVRYGKNKRTILLLWNLIGLVFLFNIVVNAVLSVPFPIQQFAFDQPNIAVLYFPFNLLPGFVVPVVLLSHLAAIRKLLLNNQ